MNLEETYSYPGANSHIDEAAVLRARVAELEKVAEAAKALRKAAGEADAELVVSQDVLKAFGFVKALCAYDAALAALEGRD